MLPKLDIPTYKLQVPSTNKTVEYRPFLVKEEKVLLTMMEGLDEDNADAVVKEAIEKVITNCIITDGLNIKKLTLFDQDYMFLQIRSKSRGESIDPVFECVNEVGGKRCGHENTVHIDLNDVGVVFPEEDLSKVEITDSIGIQFKYLDSATASQHDKIEDTVDRLFKIMVDSIDYIYDNEQIYKGSETPKKELLDFIENLTEDAFKRVKQFFDEQPVVKHIAHYKCEKCGYEEDIPFIGSEAFFGYA